MFHYKLITHKWRRQQFGKYLQYKIWSKSIQQFSSWHNIAQKSIFNQPKNYMTYRESILGIKYLIFFCNFCFETFFTIGNTQWAVHKMCTEMHGGLHVNCALCDFNLKWNASTNFIKSNQYQISRKPIQQFPCCYMWTGTAALLNNIWILQLSL